MTEKQKLEIQNLISEKNESEIIKFLDINPLYNLFSPIDEKNNNCFHRICFLNSTSIFYLFLTHIKNSKENISELINIQNASGFTPLHYSCYKGNMQIIKELINLGSNISLKNKKGLNVLHLASQGNQVNVLAYFIEKYKIDPMSLDEVYSTPLHWACYFGCENCADFLLSYKRVNINFCDKEGRTPLHIAVLSENINLIKKLVRFGADKNAKDNNDNTPLELAEIKKKKNVVKILKKEKKICKCIIIKPPVQKIEKSYANIILFFILYGFSLTANIIILMPFINEKNTFWVYLITHIINFILYFILICYNPGVNKDKMLKIGKEKFFLPIIEKGGEVKKYCPRCLVKKTKNMRHCFICDRCIDNFDHHCYWTNNCVGKSNYKIFIFFVLINIFILSFNDYLDFKIIFLCQNFNVDCNNNYFQYCNQFKEWYKDFIIKIVAISNFFLCIIFDFLLIALLALHIRNFFYNKKIRKNLLVQDTDEKLDILGSTEKK